MIPRLPGVTVAIPTIPPRAKFLTRAVASVAAQTLPASAISIAVDTAHDGAWVTRQRALDAVLTGWVAFLDDDDEFETDHLAVLTRAAFATGADYVYSYFTAVGMGDPFTVGHGPDGLLNAVFDPVNPTHTTTVVVVKTELAKHVGFTPPDPGDVVSGEDWRFTQDCVKAGAKIVHVPQRTWRFHYHPYEAANTSGRPDLW